MLNMGSKMKMLIFNLGPEVLMHLVSLAHENIDFCHFTYLEKR